MKVTNRLISPARILRAVTRQLKRARTKYARIGPYEIHLPAGNQNLEYKKIFRLYDTALGGIASVLRNKYPDIHAIDIGANAGDTAALIRESAEIPVLCIEGDPNVLPYLQENAAKLGEGIEIEPTFVGSEGQTANLELAKDLGFNASIVAATAMDGDVQFRALSSILAAHPRFAGAKLLKTDTEGFDFDILRQSLEFIGRSKPVIFFEYGPHFHPDEPDAGLDTLSKLISLGYSDFIYYDNFGNYLLHADKGNQELLDDLDCYLGSHRRHGVVIPYFDICAFHHEDADLVSVVKLKTQR